MEKEKNNVISIREYACGILNVFEDLLDEHGIDIPDKNREGEEDEAHLFGDAYYATEDRVVEILTELLEKVKENPEAKIQEDFA